MKLIKKGENFVWTPYYEEGFHKLNGKLVTTPIPTIPLGSDRFLNYSDESHKGLDCILMQHGRVITYVSHQLQD